MDVCIFENTELCTFRKYSSRCAMKSEADGPEIRRWIPAYVPTEKNAIYERDML